MAHRISTRESEATLGLGNIAAADLRMGQAIINLDYGAIASNKKVAIAWADEVILSGLREKWWQRVKDRIPAPYVFDGGKTIRLSSALDKMTSTRGDRPTVIIGEEISVNGTSMLLDFGAELGRNIAIFGAGANHYEDTHSGGGNNAIGLLQSAAITLAFQNIKGNALFMLCNLMDEGSDSQNNMFGFEQLMASLGFTLELLSQEQFLKRIDELAAGLVNGTQPDDTIYSLGFGLEKIRDMPKSFGDLVKNGPVHGIHLLGWWQKSNVFESHVGFGNSGFFDIKILLRLDEREAQHLLGPFTRWKPRKNRALVADSTYLTEPVTIIPYSPVNTFDCEQIKSALF
jgi:hypothetical protein